MMRLDARKAFLRFLGLASAILALILIPREDAQAQECAPRPSGMLSWWQGDDSAADFFETNNGALLNGAGYTNGKVGQAFFFDAAQQEVDVGPATNLWLQDFTIEAWIMRASSNFVSYDPSGVGVVFGFGALGYALAVNSNGFPLLSKIQANSVSATGAVFDTNWHHVAVTVTNGLVAFYIDGAPAGKRTYHPGYLFSTHAAIGGRNDTLGNSFFGAIDEVSVYDRALDSNEVAAIYAAGSAGKCMTIQIYTQPASQGR